MQVMRPCQSRRHVLTERPRRRFAEEAPDIQCLGETFHPEGEVHFEAEERIDPRGHLTARECHPPMQDHSEGQWRRFLELREGCEGAGYLLGRVQSGGPKREEAVAKRLVDDPPAAFEAVPAVRQPVGECPAILCGPSCRLIPLLSMTSTRKSQADSWRTS